MEVSLKHIGFLLLKFCCVISIVQAQPEEFNSLEFFYVENSNINSVGGLSGAQLDRLTQLLETTKNQKDSKVVLFISNGPKPYLVEDPQSISLALNPLYEQFMQPPTNLREEWQLLKETLTSDAWLIKEKCNFYIFSTKGFSERLINSYPIIFRYWTDTMSYLNPEAALSVIWHIPQEISLSAEKINDKLSWADHIDAVSLKGISPKPKYQITTLEK